ncbi:hypothetical protein [uncultured Photobacterium sp.]|uniref:hypothetical protein n=1 Tax=uncultured Photobacterium sp. TaxID=173973 RepID=UPI0026290E0F|nr:hypothetical protein [uncultured Photobacterium sp.]
MVTSVAFSMLYFFLFAASTLPGYSHFPYTFHWKTEVRETNRSEEKREKSDSFDFAFLPAEPPADLQRKQLTLPQIIIEPAKHRQSTSSQSLWRLQHQLIHNRLIEKRFIWQKTAHIKQIRPWHLIAMKAVQLPALIMFQSPSEHRLGGWKESNAIYRALNDHPV